MPGISCVLVICTNNNCKTVKEGKDISFFFHFLKTIEKTWIVKCKKVDAFNPNTSFIFLEQFEEIDFELNLKKKLVREPTKKTKRVW